MMLHNKSINQSIKPTLWILEQVQTQLSKNEKSKLNIQQSQNIVKQCQAIPSTLQFVSTKRTFEAEKFMQNPAKPSPGVCLTFNSSTHPSPALDSAF